MNLKSKINHLFESRVSKKQASSSTFYAHSSSLEIISSAMTNKVSELTLSAHPYQLINSRYTNLEAPTSGPNRIQRDYVH